MTKAELKPCPFCGSNDVRAGGDDKVVGAWCEECGAQGPNGYHTSTEWNHRPTEQALAEALRSTPSLGFSEYELKRRYDPGTVKHILKVEQALALVGDE